MRLYILVVNPVVNIERSPPLDLHGQQFHARAELSPFATSSSLLASSTQCRAFRFSARDFALLGT
jgi:hypothetical protein